MAFIFFNKITTNNFIKIPSAPNGTFNMLQSALVNYLWLCNPLKWTIFSSEHTERLSDLEPCNWKRSINFPIIITNGVFLNVTVICLLYQYNGLMIFKIKYLHSLFVYNIVETIKYKNLKQSNNYNWNPILRFSPAYIRGRCFLFLIELQMIIRVTSHL